MTASQTILKNFEHEVVLLNNMLKQDHILLAKDLSEFQLFITKTMAEQGDFVNVANRIFVAKDYASNDFLIRQLLLEQGLYYGQTALYLWELSDTFPYKIQMAFRPGYHLPKRNYLEWTQNIIVKQVREPLLSTNIEQLSLAGTRKKIHLYSPERTLVDIVRRRNEFDQETINQAYKRYLHSPKRHLNKLLAVAKQTNGEKQVRNIVKILL
ncbi:type IV toxin-antitoxin system AbiEi family antitoxin domain-containing protein [Oenococcus sp.]|uniref:type IV toxin-antitoxin system AbiEi family antitoxin domain-containing protein n=1 Tax=Oenococcus sp. TaxID=1979414 RepID=UPI0039EBF208